VTAGKLITLRTTVPRSGGELAHRPCQFRVKAAYGGVNTPSGDVARGGRGCRLSPVAIAVGVIAEVREWRVMADLAYAVLIIGVFGVLALVLRGLERL
jgi:hypothetical protein